MNRTILYVAALLGLAGCIVTAAAQQGPEGVQIDAMSPEQLQQCNQNYDQGTSANTRCLVGAAIGNMLDFDARFRPFGDIEVGPWDRHGRAAFLGVMQVCHVPEADMSRMRDILLQDILPATLNRGIAAGRAAFADAPEGTCAYVRALVKHEPALQERMQPAVREPQAQE